MANRTRIVMSLAVLWLVYQSAEGLGERWLHSFAVQAGLMLACVLLAWPVSRWLGYCGYGAFALDSRKFRTWLPAGLLLALLAKFTATWLGLRLGVYVADTEPPADAHTWSALSAALPMLLVATFVPSIAEDILTRGFWYRAARIRWRSGTVFVLASSTLYVLNHIYRLHYGPLEWLMLFCFGLAYAAALWRSGSLWAALGLHWGWNLGNGLVAEFLPIETFAPRMAALLSIGAHLVMLALVCAVPSRRRKLEPPLLDAESPG